MNRPNAIRDKSLEFAIEVVKLSQRLQSINEFVLSRQLMRSGTACGALVREAEQAESKKDFIHKLSIALKEVNETDYWLEVLYRSDYLNKDEYLHFHSRNKELLRLLTSIINTSKQRLRA